MRDLYGRTIDYLRLSVTDLCNYRCIYCMPESGVCKRAHHEILSIEELVEICRAAVRCGIKKIRLTGGEPLARQGILELCRQVRAIDGLQELVMTTNGSMLREQAETLKKIGVDRLNISLDTLKRDRFQAITRRDGLPDVLDGIQAAQEAGFTGTKLNVVLMGGVNDDEISDFVGLTRNRDLSVRFIELMPMHICADWPQERFLPAEVVLQTVPELERVNAEGVAELFHVQGWQGTVGLIRPLSQCFCGTCNRIRITADGKMKPCLHSNCEIPLRGIHGEKLEAALRAGIMGKPPQHHLGQEVRSRSDRNMNQIGG